MNRWLLLLGAIVTEVTASLSLKGALDHPALYVVVVLGYAGTFGFLAAVLGAGMPLGVAYGIWGALGVAATAALSAIFFGEALTGVMILGIAVVIAGVVLVEFGSHLAGRQEAA
ncbi:DMT family transporter [Nocardioides bizhenqiangii]|uniref:SMR family transporter n=1 Tax=Nocardioides bizhenqiangii TaxID=3095076 RepID=A0ABZ0ZW47_9ACTN|nr:MULTISPECIES: SMR family transporter [unclassified Nocardioides]MDZ5622243.1 SMR family transporter [Nocardioides sp. HM23]WQQ28582.1 SMR family transporter [Nocardioides sp. HM61]